MDLTGEPIDYKQRYRMERQANLDKQHKILGIRAHKQRKLIVAEQEQQAPDPLSTSSSSSSDTIMNRDPVTMSTSSADSISTDDSSVAAAPKPKRTQSKKLTLAQFGGNKADLAAARRARKTEVKRILRAKQKMQLSETEMAARRAKKNEQRKALRAKQKAKETAQEAAARLAHETEQRRLLRRKIAAEEGPEQRAARRTRGILSRQHFRDACNMAKCLPNNDDFKETNVTVHNLGQMDHACTYCQAIHFKDEKPSDGAFKYCCRKGTVLLDESDVQPKRPFPQYLQDLLQNPEHPEYRKFHADIRSYNSVLSFASMGARLDVDTDPPLVFRVHGQIYHHRSTSPRRSAEKREELYFVDFALASKPTNQRSIAAELDSDIVQRLHTIIREHNVYADDFRLLGEVEHEEQQRAVPAIVNLSFLHDDNDDDDDRYDSPAADEIGTIFFAIDYDCPVDRDYRFYQRNMTREPPLKLTNISKHLDPMCYVLFYPNGEPGWQPKLPNNVCPKAGVKQRTQITLLQWKVAQMAIRAGHFNPILHGGKLFQQWAIDALLLVESNNNAYLQMYHNDRPAPDESSDGKTHRSLREKYHDAIAIVARFGKPDLFITIHFNPNWPEVVDNLFPGQTLNDRPDLIVRVFSIKLKHLFEEITKSCCFGRVQAFVYTVKFEKQALPKAHMFLILDGEHKMNTAEKIDRYICAEIPDETREPQLYRTVFEHMIHGPCGDGTPNADCMQFAECRDEFPKKFNQKTSTDVNGKTVYRRIECAPVRFEDILADNRFVIPYNKSLTLRYNCYINVESCQSDNVLKLMFKSICSGNTMTTMEFRTVAAEEAERRRNIKSRYVSGLEAVWRLLEKPMHVYSHSIYRLDIHLPGEQIDDRYKTQSEGWAADGDDDATSEGNTSNSASTAESRLTTLTAWFELNKIDEKARKYRYAEIPRHYVFDRKLCVWKTRQKFHDKVVARVMAVSPNAGEKFYLRLLLHHVCGGVQSFVDLRTVDGTVEQSFREAAVKLQLLDDDDEWKRCLADASTVCQQPWHVRQMYALICAFNSPGYPTILFDTAKPFLLADYRQKFDESTAERKALQDIEAVLQMHGMKCNDLGLPKTQIFAKEFVVNVADENVQAERLIETLNAEQREIFDEIKPRIGFSGPLEERFFFIDGPSGAGKTYLFKALMCYVRSLKRTAYAFATTEIATSLLAGGRTVESGFKIPNPVTDESESDMSFLSDEAEQLREASLLFVDEASMLSTHALRVIDNLLKSIMIDNRPFGGKLLILTGDFRQCTSSDFGGDVSNVTSLFLKRSPLWHFAAHRILSGNMRSADDDDKFNDWLLRLGEGRLAIDSVDPDLVVIPALMVERKSIVRAIFGRGGGGTAAAATTDEQLAEMATKIILVPKQADVIEPNNEVLSLIAGDERIYASIDTLISDDPNDLIDFQPEFLHEQCPVGMPPHLLRLKVGAVIMLLRSLNRNEGLFNGIRLVVKSLHRDFIEAEIITGAKRGVKCCIPRLVFQTNYDTTLPFQMIRRQFPVMLAFAVTIDKAQGQSFDHVGIYLPESVFSHGQLYSALARGRRQVATKVFVKDRFYQGRLHNNDETVTRNVINEQILSQDY